ncbi:MAG: hypothetical protein V2I35_05795, partial [Desulfocapsaceae bacterium]|nr:hypothetical protein [Desulfocapsaceae bacterium]
MARQYPEQHFQFDNCSVTLFKHGDKKYTKASYPVRTGIYSEIATGSFVYHFNLNSEIIRVIGTTAEWPHPHEWLKRTAGNDWIYYSTGGYSGVFETTGEYYLPNLPYLTNNALGGKPFNTPYIQSAAGRWHDRLKTLQKSFAQPGSQVSEFLNSVLAGTPEYLAGKAGELQNCCGGKITVLPPDTRHVDYNVIPLSLSEGCLYKCEFCKVKNSKPFSTRSTSQISGQIIHLQKLYGADLINFNSLFLGEHDGLCSDRRTLLFAIHEAIDKLSLNKSWCPGSNIFLFGSVFSLLNTPISVFDE